MGAKRPLRLVYYKYVTITPECVARGERLVSIEVKGGGITRKGREGGGRRGGKMRLL